MKKTLALVAALLLASCGDSDDSIQPPSPSDEEVRLACLSENLTVTNIRFSEGGDRYYEPPEMSFEITNNLSWAVSSISFSYKIRSEDRSVPWVNQPTRVGIAGGIEPGETAEVTIDLRLSDEAKEQFGRLIGEIELDDAHDADEKSYVRKYMNTEQTDKTCP